MAVTTMKRALFLSVVFSIFLAPLALLAGPTASITDTAAPIRVDGDLSDWTSPAVITLDKKENVVVGAGDWTGPDLASARVHITYDKTNLYIGADITSKNPQFNTMNAADIYNGDALEIYFGTDSSNPQRKSYSPTDVQIVVSPGKGGEGAEVYSVTDKGDIPGAKIATKLNTGGYTMELSIPLVYFYKLDMGPGKAVGFDIAVDDVGPTSKTRALQLAWSQQDKSWQDPSGWGSLQFKGDTVFVNTAGKQAMPGAQSVEMDPMAGKKDASTLGTQIWGFNGDVGGFEGKVSAESTTVSEGSGALRVDTDGSQGWNQNLATCSSVPMANQWENFKTITFDAYYPKGSLDKANYAEIFVTTSSPANNFDQAIKVKMKEGWNHVKADVDSSQFKGGVNKIFFIFNSGGPITGSIILDNIRGVQKGAPASLKGKVTNKAGNPIAGADVAISKKLVKTESDGTFKMDLPEDEYAAEVFAPGYKSQKKTVQVGSGKDNSWTVVLEPDTAVLKKAVVDVFFDKKIRTFNPHYMFGNNIAAWHDPKCFTDPAAMKEMGDISSYIRVPGGAYGNIWQWKTSVSLQKDGKTPQTTWPFGWPQMVDFIKRLPNGEMLLIANIMTMDVQNMMDWIADAKAQGLKIKYVELGNEPDYEADLQHDGQGQYWTVIDNYCQHYLEFGKAIRAKYPDIKIMGPTPAQVQNHERKEGSPWLAPETSPWWVEGFLEKCGDYVDVVSVHSYPYWSNDSDSNLLSKTSLWSEYIPKIREAIKKNIPNRYQDIEIAVSEWNSGDENSTTAKLVNGIFCADYLAQMMLWGVNQTNIWDMFTQKPGQGGGHGMLDPTGDPDRPYAPRAHYWALFMLEHYFGNTLYQAVSNTDDLSAYASTARGKKYVLVINKNPKATFKTSLNLGGGLKGKVKLDIYELSSKEYQWSENLYRAVINSGPAHLKAAKAVGNRFEYTFPPYSITCFEMTPAK